MSATLKAKISSQFGNFGRRKKKLSISDLLAKAEKESQFPPLEIRKPNIRLDIKFWVVTLSCFLSRWFPSLEKHVAAGLTSDIPQLQQWTCYMLKCGFVSLSDKITHLVVDLTTSDNQIVRRMALLVLATQKITPEVDSKVLNVLRKSISLGLKAKKDPSFTECMILVEAIERSPAAFARMLPELIARTHYVNWIGLMFFKKIPGWFEAETPVETTRFLCIDLWEAFWSDIKDEDTASDWKHSVAKALLPVWQRLLVQEPDNPLIDEIANEFALYALSSEAGDDRRLLGVLLKFHRS